MNQRPDNTPTGTPASERSDPDAVRALLGREPQGHYRIVVRADDGTPVVIENAPLLNDGTPMPTRYWLVGPAEIRAVSRLEADGGVRRAEAEVDADEIARAHELYAHERDAVLGDHDGPRPSGGVGGTRTGVKCLHAHYAWYLAGGPDPVGRWVAGHLDIAPASSATGADTDRAADGATESSTAGARAPASGPVSVSAAMGIDSVTISCGDWHEPLFDMDHSMIEALGRRDPPAAEDLTNALGLITDTMVEIRRRHRELLDVAGLELTGVLASSLARVELGSDTIADSVTITRDDLEEVFRLLVTETRHDRRDNPGLDTDQVDIIVPAACAAVGLVRWLHLDEVTVGTTPAGATDRVGDHPTPNTSTPNG